MTLGLSENALLADLMGSAASSVSFTELTRPIDGSTSVLLAADGDLAAPSGFVGGQLPVFWAERSRDRLRASASQRRRQCGRRRRDRDQPGGALDLYVHTGPYLMVTAHASPTTVKPGRPVTFTASRHRRPGAALHLGRDGREAERDAGRRQRPPNVHLDRGVRGARRGGRVRRLGRHRGPALHHGRTRPCTGTPTPAPGGGTPTPRPSRRTSTRRPRRRAQPPPPRPTGTAPGSVRRGHRPVPSAPERSAAAATGGSPPPAGPNRRCGRAGRAGRMIGQGRCADELGCGGRAEQAGRGADRGRP